MDERVWEELLAEIGENVEAAQVAMQGRAALAVIDVGCLDCGETPVVRGVFTDAGEGRRVFDDECRRHEILPADVAKREVPWEEFVRAGASACVMAGAYTSVDAGAPADGPACGDHRCGRRVLGLFITRVL